MRFVEVLCPNVGGDRWDQHGGLKQGHEDNARATDQPIAGLLHDLKSRGLLETTLVVWLLISLARRLVLNGPDQSRKAVALFAFAAVLSRLDALAPIICMAGIGLLGERSLAACIAEREPLYNDRHSAIDGKFDDRRVSCRP